MKFLSTLAILATFFSVGALSWADQIVRIGSANLTSGSAQSYDPGHGLRILKAMNLDVILIQEFNYKDNSKEAITALVHEVFGPEFNYYREEESEDSIPNGIISRYRILASGEWPDTTLGNRDYAWARIQLPGKKTLLAYSLHLSSKYEKKRVEEAREVVKFIKKQVVENEFLVVGGDLNTKTSGDGAVEILKELVSTANDPVGTDGKNGTNSSRRNHYDWVLPNAALEALQVPLEIPLPDKEGQSLKFPKGLVFDSRTFEPLSAVAPVQKGDSGAGGMQHMLVVKSFAIPE